MSWTSNTRPQGRQPCNFMLMDEVGTMSIGDIKQSDQMLDYKVAQFLPKIAQK